MRLLILALIGALFGCGSTLDEPAVPLTQPTRLCCDAAPGESCVRPEDVEHWLARADLEILGVSAAPAGKQGAKVLTVAASDSGGRVVFRAKWRAHSQMHQLNVPRREVAAYAVQKLFLGPANYIVPPATGHCFPLGNYRQMVDANAKPPFPGIDCIFGVLSYWLEGASDISDLLDEDLFWQSRSYGRSLANVNLISYLIDHGDSHPRQFVATRTDGERRVYLVDNTIAFSDFRNPKISADQDWSRLHVPALPRESVARLAALTRRDLGRLHVIEQYDNVDGQLIRTRRRNIPRNTNSSLRWMGSELQLGLDDSEIARLKRRIDEIVSGVAQGKIRVF